MNAKRAREQRRETKRTLGHQLEAFADNQHQRLVNVEGDVKELTAEKAALNDRVIKLEQTHERQRDNLQVAFLRMDEDRQVTHNVIGRRTLFGRLKWLLVGA